MDSRALEETDANPPRGEPVECCRWDLPRKYEFQRVLGSGGMGTVLLVRERNLDRLAAVKLLTTECSAFAARFLREAKVLARLEHPAIVRVHDFDEFSARWYLSMEYLPGGSLALTRLAPLALVRTLRPVVDALAHAHAHGIVHRDVKPQNVLLAEDKRAVLTDFGLALDPREDANDSGTRPIVGTPLTMSPEQARGERVGAATDVFSFGVTLYRQLTGRWPFRGRMVADVLDAICHREPASLRTLEPAVPRELDAVVLRSLAKRADDRFACMEELGRALDRVLRGRTLFDRIQGWLAGQAS